jgi:hypothetical protein
MRGRFRRCYPVARWGGRPASLRRLCSAIDDGETTRIRPQCLEILRTNLSQIPVPGTSSSVQNVEAVQPRSSPRLCHLSSAAGSVDAGCATTRLDDAGRFDGPRRIEDAPLTVMCARSANTGRPRTKLTTGRTVACLVSSRDSHFCAVRDFHAPDRTTGDPQDERAQEQQPENRAWTRGRRCGRGQQPDQRWRVVFHRRRDGTQ